MNKRRIVFDGAMLAVYLLSALPVLTGIAAHEWIGLAVAVVFAIHLTLGMAGVFRMAKAGSRAGKAVRIANIVLDALLLAAVAVVTVSGSMISATILPALGHVAYGYYFWNPLHAAAAKALLALLLVHVFVHIPWIVGFAKGRMKAADEEIGS